MSDELLALNKFILKRDIEYLNWRYCDPRGGDFVVRAIHEDGSMFGLCVLGVNLNDPDYPVGIIVDILARPGMEKLVDDLVFDAIQYFSDKSINSIKTWLVGNHPYTRLFSRQGFLDTRVHPYETYELSADLSDDLEAFKRCAASEMHHVYGDFDFI
jgi:hypothetical protein